jgi:hypothetical protein
MTQRLACMERSWMKTAHILEHSRHVWHTNHLTSKIHHRSFCMDLSIQGWHATISSWFLPRWYARHFEWLEWSNPSKIHYQAVPHLFKYLALMKSQSLYYYWHKHPIPALPVITAEACVSHLEILNTIPKQNNHTASMLMWTWTGDQIEHTDAQLQAS